MPISPFHPITGWFDPATLDDGSEPDLRPLDQASRPHIFVNKLRRRRGANKTLATRDAPSRVLSISDWAAIYAAGEFADHSHMCLDVSVTLDFARMGIFEPTEVQEALSSFIRCYGAWARERYLPVAWMYRIEMSSLTDYHAHVLVYVPGEPKAFRKFSTRTYRREFRNWAKTYTDRNLGRHIGRAVWVHCELAENRFTHWRLVTYLMKGYDRLAIICSARNSPDGFPIRLGDLIPIDYCDPGPIALKHHFGICDNLGPKQRRFGTPKGFTENLPRQPNWHTLWVDTSRMSPFQKMCVVHTLPKPTPFTSSFEDGVRDIRRLYPAPFHEFVTRLKAEPNTRAPEDGAAEDPYSLMKQLAATDD